jgi:hypothetical protein
MSSQRRREAIAAGLPVENSEAARRRRRTEAAIVREEIAITMWARGKTSKEISEELFLKTGARLASGVPELVRRGLYRRVQEGAEHVEPARELMRERYMLLLQAWMPRALERPDPDNPEVMIPPDPRALDGVLRILREYGALEGVLAPQRSGDINLNILNGVQFSDVEAREKVLASLAAEREKQMVIDGTLAGTPAARQGVIDDDGRTAPPILPKRPD